ncbi:hypothetical protein LINGRAHAP2_LOCUS20415 [Linum grandiflorum]
MDKRRTNRSSISPPPGWSLLSRSLNKAVKKINFLLSRWDLSDAIRTAAANQLRKKKQKQQRRFLSFNQKVGLQGCVELLEEGDHIHNNSTRGGVVLLDRTCSLTDQLQDVDKRAENFIANFRRGLLLERQVSLNLRYCRLHSF